MTDPTLTEQVDPASDRATYRQIADHLRAAITDGRLAPGEQLPSEARLMDHYGVARMTIRQALQVLKNEDLVIAEHGRGVFVSEPTGHLDLQEIKKNLASLNEIVMELVDQVSGDPEFRQIVRTQLSEHSHNLGFKFQGE